MSEFDLDWGGETWDYEARDTEDRRKGERPFPPGTIVMDGWEVVRVLGGGESGTVYEIRKNQMGIMMSRAMKVITIPRRSNYWDTMRSRGLTDIEISSELRRQAGEAVQEIRTMQELCNCPGMVRCENFKVVEYTDEGVWEISMIMELLTSLDKWTRKNNVTQEWVRKNGSTLAELLQQCEEHKILHRDIKPENAFVDPLGNAKLGDFGLARQLSEESRAASRAAGTDDYMAPEVANGQPYDARSDIYCLGLLLYWLLNGQRIPFLDRANYQVAVGLRHHGEPLPRIEGVEDGLMDAVLKACAFKPEDRFATGNEFSLALRGEKHRRDKAEIEVVHITVDGVDLARTTVEIPAGQTKTITAAVYDDYVLVNKKSDNTVVTVDKNGNPSMHGVTFVYKPKVKEADVDVFCRTMDGFVLKQWTETLEPGQSRTVRAPSFEDHELLPHAPTSYVVKVDENGKPTPPSVTFFFRSADKPSVVKILHKTQEGVILGDDTVTLRAGERKTVRAASFDGYVPASGSPSSVSLVVDAHGQCNRDQVVFLYRRKPTTTSVEILHKLENGTVLKKQTIVIQSGQTVTVRPVEIDGHDPLPNQGDVTITLDHDGKPVPPAVSFLYRGKPKEARITVTHQTLEGIILQDATVVLKPGEKKVFTAGSFSGYEPDRGAPRSIVITVSEDGVPDHSSVTFLYRPVKDPPFQVTVEIICKADDKELQKRSVVFRPGEKRTIAPPQIPDHEPLPESARAVTVSVSSDGKPSASSVVFRYRAVGKAPTNKIPAIRSCVKLGQYRQENDAYGRAQPIVWKVLDVDQPNHKALLISRDLLEAQPYHGNAVEVAWKNCALRRWLNREFLTTAFTEAEQKAILATKVDNSQHQGNPDWPERPDAETEDKIFLLSWKDAQRWFRTGASRAVCPTDYAVNRLAFTSKTATLNGRGAGEWWLRSPGSESAEAACVSAHGEFESASVSNDTVCIRPVMWIDYTAIAPERVEEEEKPAGKKSASTVVVLHKAKTGKQLKRTQVKLDPGEIKAIKTESFPDYTVEPGTPDTAFVTCSEQGVPGCDEIIFTYREKTAGTDGGRGKTGTGGGNGSSGGDRGRPGGDPRPPKKKKHGLLKFILLLLVLAAAAYFALPRLVPGFSWPWESSGVKAGDTVTFGSYAQSAAGNEKTPIEWIVLDVDEANGKVLLLSKYGLDVQQFRASSAYVQTVTWNNSSVKTSLAGLTGTGFMGTAFTKEERGYIVSSTVSNDASQNRPGITTASDSTQSSVFLLSWKEAWQYLGAPALRRCEPTEKAAASGYITKNEEGYAAWWLRSPGTNTTDAYIVDGDGDARSTAATERALIRPAMWVRIDAPCFGSSAAAAAQEEKAK